MFRQATWCCHCQFGSAVFQRALARRHLLFRKLCTVVPKTSSKSLSPCDSPGVASLVAPVELVRRFRRFQYLAAVGLRGDRFRGECFEAVENGTAFRTVSSQRLTDMSQLTASSPTDRTPAEAAASAAWPPPSSQQQHGQQRAGGVRPVRGVVFDMDGTLTQPTMDWEKVRHLLGLSAGADILLYMQSLSSGSDKMSNALRIVREEEERAVRELNLRDGCLEMLRQLQRRRQVELGLLTRNCDGGVQAVLELMGESTSLTKHSLFSEIVTRSFRPTKPAPEPLLYICKQWSLSPSEVVMVGDTRDDLACGQAAGATTVIIRTPYNSSILDSADFAVDRLSEILTVLDSRLE